eukprot:929320_1
MFHITNLMPLIVKTFAQNDDNSNTITQILSNYESSNSNTNQSNAINSILVKLSAFAINIHHQRKCLVLQNHIVGFIVYLIKTERNKMRHMNERTSKDAYFLNLNVYEK